MKAKYTTSKTIVECYKIRDEKDLWADITIDESDSKGRLQIASSFVDCQYYWGACGQAFKAFLLGLDIHYLAGKLGQDRWFDLEKTIALLKTQIDDYTINDTTDDLKKVLLDELKVLEHESSCKEEFVQKMWNSPKLMEMSDQLPDLVISISPLFQKFWDTLWQAFKRELLLEKPKN